VERRLPVTVPPGKRANSRVGRYHLADPFLRFFFRFIAPRQDEIGYQPERAPSDNQEQLQAFLARDCERLPQSLAGLHFLAFAILMLKRFTEAMAHLL
jgi:hypothetical protein